MTKKENPIEKIHQFQRFGSVLGLERMTRLLELLGNPQDELKVIHIAGTNGKGSVSRYIYSVMQEAGYRTGLYTSPFLENFNERIELDGRCISDSDLAVYTDKVLAAAQAMVNDGDQSPTEFEVITAIALVYFKEKDCDFAILEVGLGGTGDSTNVCRSPLVTVITSISMDHMDRLGDTIEEIAAEKAGIIKDGCPVVTSAKNPKALEVIRRRAAEKNCRIFEVKDMPLAAKQESLQGSVFDAVILGEELCNVKISMAGKHQIENAAAAMTALKVLEKDGHIHFTQQELYDGLAGARQIGRLEVMHAKREDHGGSYCAAGYAESSEETVTIIDGAHNPGGAKALADAVTAMYPEARILMVIGILADKDVDGILSHFFRMTGDFIATEPDSPRKLRAADLAAKIQSLGGQCRIVPAIEDAWRMACALAEDYDMVIYAGSLYMIGKVRTLFNRGETDAQV